MGSNNQPQNNILENNQTSNVNSTISANKNDESQKKKSFNFIKKHKEEQIQNSSSGLESIDFNQTEPPKQNSLDMNALNQIYQEQNNEKMKINQQKMNMAMMGNNPMMAEMYMQNLRMIQMQNLNNMNNLQMNMNNMNIGFSQMNNMNIQNTQPTVYDGLFDPALMNQQQSQIMNYMMNDNKKEVEKKAEKIDPFNNLLDLMK